MGMPFQMRTSLPAFAIILVALFCCEYVQGFGVGGFTTISANLRASGKARSSRRGLALTCELNQVEAKAVAKFTTNYDKLCKTCPTRLEPRVDTLTEMILGLPDAEFKQLVANVALRLSTQNPAVLASLAAPTPGMGTQAAMPVSMPMGAAAIDPPKFKMEPMMGEPKMKEDNMSEKKCKVEKKMLEKKMDLAMYKAEKHYFEGVTTWGPQVQEDVKAAAFAVMKKEVALPEMQQMEHMRMELELTMKLMDLHMMDAMMRNERKCKLDEKMMKCMEKLQKYEAELKEMAGMSQAVGC